jgi:hypothetical protein
MAEQKPLFTRTAFGLTPEGEAARELMNSIPIGSVIEVGITRPRNIRFHRLYWALCQTIAESIGARAEAVSDVIKLRSGHFTVIQTKNERFQVPKSISFARMKEHEFKSFFERATLFICEELLPNMKPSDLRRQIEQMVGLPPEDAIHD